MFWLVLVVAILTVVRPVLSKGVFAHFMVPNCENFTHNDWIIDITAAKEAHIDAFAMNTGYGMIHTARSLDAAFNAAAELDFKLFLSLDYSGDGHWPKDQVITWLSNYTKRESYYRHHDGKPLVSTFEGAEAAGDWQDIKKKIDCVFIPDWTSQGAARASSSSVIDGLMSWDAWPNGATPMNTTEDEGYMEHLAGKPYIMPVSPWFYTNLIRFHKNWVWQGDDLWFTRWEQVLEVDPEYVEILTWNDFGESHYIGPMHEDNMSIFYFGGAPFDYAADMPHDAWRTFLPYVIQQFKSGPGEEVEIETEGLTVWYRVTPAKLCDDGKTEGNSVQQAQKTMSPAQVLQDKIFFSALLEGSAEVQVSVGGVNRSATWATVPPGGRGIYHGSIPMGDRTGEVVVTLTRNDRFLAQMHGRNITDECPGNQTNWNAWVGNATALASNRIGSASKTSAATKLEVAATGLTMMTTTTTMMMIMITMVFLGRTKIG